MVAVTRGGKRVARWDIRAVDGLPADSGPAALVVTVDGYLGEDDVRALCAAVRARTRRTLGLLFCDVRGVARPDIGTVGALARIGLLAERMGCAFAVRSGSDLSELIDLAGLSERFGTGRSSAEGSLLATLVVSESPATGTTVQDAASPGHGCDVSSVPCVGGACPHHDDGEAQS